MDTAPPNVSEHGWMEHEATGHRAQLPDLPYWRANGWSPVDGPHPEDNPALDVQPEMAQEVESKPKSTKASKTKSTEDGDE